MTHNIEQAISNLPNNATENEINAEIQRLDGLTIMAIIRKERNSRLSDCDWRFTTDVTQSPEWLEYRQTLRDFPANVDISQLTSDDATNINELVNWPDRPDKPVVDE